MHPRIKYSLITRLLFFVFISAALDQDLVTSHCYLTGQAVTSPGTHVYPDSGTIQGVKINKTQWKVKLHVVFPPPAGSPLGRFDLETVYTLQP